MTPQQAFDRVAKHLLEQGRKSMGTMPDGSSACAYRGEDGTACAVGCLIPDECYDEVLENTVAGALLQARIPHHMGLAPVDRQVRWESSASCVVESLGGPTEAANLVPLLVRLQEIHDYIGVGFWKESLREAAKRCGLDPAVLNATIDQQQPSLGQ